MYAVLRTYPGVVQNFAWLQKSEGSGLPPDLASLPAIPIRRSRTKKSICRDRGIRRRAS